MKNIAIILIMVIGVGCQMHTPANQFTPLAASQTGINFNNTIDESKMKGDALNEFAYMGGGVGIIDVNNDGLNDIFFCGNQVSSKLYLNEGNHHFKDITSEAGVATSDWITGVSIVDINSDGFDDIYLCTYGKELGTPSKNLLFINQQHNNFKEASAAYGLADSGYSSQAAFFDYDKDGDLDMFLVNYLLNASYSANNVFPKDLSGFSKANDKLYRNDGDSSGLGHPIFTNVSTQAGIKEDGYGLGLAVSDFNNDGWPDLYVSNDFVSNDELWVNNKNGTFSNLLSQSTGHQSYSSMGIDAADFNNDGNIDFATLDMMPETNLRKKLTFSFMNYDRYEAERKFGYTPEFARNMLQLNNGTYISGDTAIPFFSEIGQMAGVSETDWSWSVLFADFNNDGFKDMHVTNGIGRDFINADFIQFSQTLGQNTTSETDAKALLREKLVSLKQLNLPNYLFLNIRDYTFKNVSDSSGLNKPAISNGCAYADLDNDGDLDLVVNNINSEAFVLVNNSIQKKQPFINHSIGFLLKGDGLNTNGFGAKVFVYANGQMQVQEQAPVRGYLSTVDKKLLFGTAKNTEADSVLIIWPDDRRQTIYKLKTDSVYELHQSEATHKLMDNKLVNVPFFTDVTDAVNVQYKHNDVPFYDYAYQRLLPQKFSQLGPFISTGDINNDGNTDFFIGGAFNFSGQLFAQNTTGKFASKPLSNSVKFEEDVANILFDADGDGDLDLLITYGDTRYEDTSMFYQPKLFVNDGKGNYTVSNNAIPAAVKTIAGCVTTGDYDGDGDMDVFIGGRVSKTYPVAPRSYILQNNKGLFKDVTEDVCAPLRTPGMITAAVWVDFDNDKMQDLVIAGEYMPVRIFKNNHAKLTEITATTGLQNYQGMWRSLIATDVDNDGDVDIVAGNLGSNCKYHISSEYPMQLFAKDIDGNGSIDPVMFYYIKDEKGKRSLFPSIGRDQFAEQVPLIKKAFLKHQDYADATSETIYKGDNSKLQVLTCNESRSCWFENTGNNKFVLHALPQEAQFAPVNAMVCTDVDGDGFNDLILAGNEYQTDVITGRYDASYGCFLKGDGRKGFKAVAANKSGMLIKGDVKDLKVITNSRQEKLILVAINDENMKVFKCNEKPVSKDTYDKAKLQ